MQGFSSPSSFSVTSDNVFDSFHCKIIVVGVGGGGCNALEHMINHGIAGQVEYVAINTDVKSLKRSKADRVLQIGYRLTNGWGAGSDPNIGRVVAEEERDAIKKAIFGDSTHQLKYSMVFITAGMGGGTGTGASPVIAQIAKEAGAHTIAVVNKPFSFEGKRHLINAEAGINELSKYVNAYVCIDNNKLLTNLGVNVSIINAFNKANDILYNAVLGIASFVTECGHIHVDFSDVVRALSFSGATLIGIGHGKGPNNIEDAIREAIQSPIVEPLSFGSAQAAIVQARVGLNFPMLMWNKVLEYLGSYLVEEAFSKFGFSFDENYADDEISIIALITGISDTQGQNIDTATAKARAQASIRKSQGYDVEINYRDSMYGTYPNTQDRVSSNTQNGFEANNTQGFRGNGSNLSPYATGHADKAPSYQAGASNTRAYINGVNKSNTFGMPRFDGTQDNYNARDLVNATGQGSQVHSYKSSGNNSKPYMANTTGSAVGQRQAKSTASIYNNGLNANVRSNTMVNGSVSSNANTVQNVHDANRESGFGSQSLKGNTYSSTNTVGSNSAEHMQGLNNANGSANVNTNVSAHTNANMSGTTQGNATVSYNLQANASKDAKAQGLRAPLQNIFSAATQDSHKDDNSSPLDSSKLQAKDKSEGLESKEDSLWEVPQILRNRGN